MRKIGAILGVSGFILLGPASALQYTEARDLQAKQMTPTQLAEAQKRAADWQATFEKRQAD